MYEPLIDIAIPVAGALALYGFTRPDIRYRTHKGPPFKFEKGARVTQWDIQNARFRHGAVKRIGGLVDRGELYGVKWDGSGDDPGWHHPATLYAEAFGPDWD